MGPSQARRWQRLAVPCRRRGWHSGSPPEGASGRTIRSPQPLHERASRACAGTISAFEGRGSSHAPFCVLTESLARNHRSAHALQFVHVDAGACGSSAARREPSVRRLHGRRATSGSRGTPSGRWRSGRAHREGTRRGGQHRPTMASATSTPSVPSGCALGCAAQRAPACARRPLPDEDSPPRR